MSFISYTEAIWWPYVDEWTFWKLSNLGVQLFLKLKKGRAKSTRKTTQKNRYMYQNRTHTHTHTHTHTRKFSHAPYPVSREGVQAKKNRSIKPSLCFKINIFNRHNTQNIQRQKRKEIRHFDKMISFRFLKTYSPSISGWATLANILLDLKRISVHVKKRE